MLFYLNSWFLSEKEIVVTFGRYVRIDFDPFLHVGVFKEHHSLHERQCSVQLQTHPCSVSHSSPLLGYTTQLMLGLSRDLAESSRGSTTAGGQQLTPTASSWDDLLATFTASVNRLPSEIRFASWGGLAQRESSRHCGFNAS